MISRSHVPLNWARTAAAGCRLAALTKSPKNLNPGPPERCPAGRETLRSAKAYLTPRFRHARQCAPRTDARRNRDPPRHPPTTRLGGSRISAPVTSGGTVLRFALLREDPGGVVDGRGRLRVADQRSSADRTGRVPA